MKKLALLILGLIIAQLSANQIQLKTLENGMQIATKENNSNQSAAFYCFVKTGSLNEGKYLGAGISHYLEHVVSSGSTTKRSEAEYNKIGKEIGASTNAYTSTKATAYHLVVNAKYAEDALDMLSEQMQFCKFDSFEVAREKEVILKEFVLRSTPVNARIRQRNNELVYPNSNNKYPVIGYVNLFKQITREELQDYYKNRYAPNNMIFVAVGNFNAKEMLTKIEERFIDFPRSQITPPNLPTQSKKLGSIKYMEEFDTELSTVSISYIVNQSNYSDYFAIDAALSTLFDKRKSPIKYELKEKLDLVNYIYSYIKMNSASKEGLINITFNTKDVLQIDDIVEIIDEKIDYYVDKGFQQKDIDNIVQRYKAYRTLSTPNPENECNRIGWSLMQMNVADPTDLYIAEYSKLTPKDLQLALKKYLQKKDRIIFSAVPKGSKQLFYSDSKNEVVKSEIQRIEINNKLTLLHKRNTTKPIIRGIVHIPLTTKYETKKTVGSISMMTSLMLKGSKKFHSLDITEWEEDHVASLYSSSNEDGTTFTFKCLKSDFPYLKMIMLDAFDNPTFTKDEIDIYKKDKLASFMRSKKNPDSNHNDFKNAILYPNHPFSVNSNKKNEIIQDISQQDLFAIHKKLFLAEKMIVTLFGDITVDEAKDISKDFRNEVSSKKIENIETPFKIDTTNQKHINSYKFEQVNIDINFQAVSWTDDDSKVFQVINNILSGSRGRLHNATRGTDNLAYFAYSYYSPKIDNGFLRLKSQTSIDKKDTLVEVMQNEIKKLIDSPVPQDEIDVAINERKMMLESYLNDNSIPSFITRYEARGLGYDFFNIQFKQLETVTPKDIQRVAKKYLKNSTVIVSIPDDSVELMID